VFRRFRRQQETDARVGIALGDGDQLVMLHGRDTEDGVTLEGLCSAGLESPGDLGSRLSAWVNDHDLQGACASFVLAPEDYQVVMIESPQVAEAELREAARWGARDFLKFDVQDAVIDVFAVPSPQSRAKAAMLNVVAAEKSRVDALCASLSAASLKPSVVDIPELCLRNLALGHEQHERGLGIVYLDKEGGLLSLVRGDELFLTRRISVGASALDAADVESRAQLLDEIVLELQRSFDYYERQYGQPPIRQVLVAPSQPNTDFVADQLRYELNIDVVALDLAIMKGYQADVHDIAGIGVLAAGALQRNRGDWL